MLAGRTQEANVALQQKFTRFSLDSGILPENIAILQKNSTWFTEKLTFCIMTVCVNAFAISAATGECPEESV